MVFAAYSMSNNKRFSNRQYAWLREQAADYLSEMRRGPNNPMYGKTPDPEMVSRRSAARRGISSPLKGRKIPKLNHADVSGEKNPFFGKKHSDETKSRISKSKMGKPSSRKGTTLSEDMKQHLREANLGKTRTDATKAKISATLKGRPKAPFTDEHRQNISEAMKRRSNSLHHLSEDEKRQRANAIENERARMRRASESEVEREVRREKQRERYRNKNNT